MKVIYVEPHKEAAVIEIGSALEDMQAAVDGYIEAVYPFDDPVAIVCNEEGKLKNMPYNRVLMDQEDNRPIDILCGPFFICGLTEDSFTDIPEDLTEKYLDMFLLPQRILPSPTGGILVMFYHPDEKEE